MKAITDVYAVRGAVCAEENEKYEIYACALRLANELREKNLTPESELVSIVISMTPDITASYPATALRDNGFGAVPLFSCVEPDVENSLPLCIRMLFTVKTRAENPPPPRHVYLGKAASLRPDLGLGT